MPTGYRIIRARGNFRELGRQHGEQCRDQLTGFLDYLAATLRLSMDELMLRAARFRPLFDQVCPHLVEELRGLSEGAGVAFEQALIPQIRGELAGIQPEACTTFVVASQGTALGQPLIGQNCDMEVEYGEFGYVLQLEPTGKPPLIMWTFGGQIGYHGMNRAGVAHFANALAGGPAWRWGLPHYPIKRMILEQSRLGQITDLFRRAPVCSNGNYVLCDGDGMIADAELTPLGFEFMPEPESGFLVHTNHYLCGEHACQANYDLSLPDSFNRLDQMKQRVARKFGSITVDDMKGCLADHGGFPTSICRHPHDGPDHPSVSARGRTVTSIVAEPGAGRFHVARGNPCEVEYQTYELG